MNKKTSILIMLLIISIFLSGCTLNLGFGSSKEVVVTDVYTGSNGLEFAFLENLPPNGLYAEEEFQIGIRMINKGAYPISNAILTITGDQGYITFMGSGLSDSETISLEGKTNYNPRDDEEILYFDIITDFADPEFTEHDSTLLLSACYEYENKLSTMICIDPDTYNLKPLEKTCQAGSQSFPGQGGPVGVSNIVSEVKETNGDLYPRFRITITNFGSGEALYPGNIAAFCSSQNVPSTMINRIRITNIAFSDIVTADLDCFPALDSVELRGGKAEVVCALREGSPKRLDPNTGTYTTNLVIEFDYGYSISDSKTITIINQN
ncbi:hypothetical protein GOV05_04425 [Candidatus Woesearchaeota archaeon]|nr:hypothetical protein [Candidatus Woesearchaeota archaeon]